MNIDDMTFGELKRIAAMFSGAKQINTSITSDAVGKYVLVRSRNEGVNAGNLVAADETGCILEDARRLHYHKPKDSSSSWYEGVAVSGLHKDSRTSCAVERKYIIEDYSVTVCSAESEKSIRAAKSHES